MKKINLMVNLIRFEYNLFVINPSDFFLAKKEKIIRDISSKTEEQKALLSVIIGFLVLDLVIIFSDTFDILAVFKFFPDLWMNEKLNIYFSFIIIQSVLKFIILTYYNPKNPWHNFKTALPYIGGVYASYFFLKRTKKT